MKKMIIFLLVAGMAIKGKAQELPLSQLKDSAGKYYMLQMKAFCINDTTPPKYDSLLNHFWYYRDACLRQLATPSERKEFEDYLFARFKRYTASQGDR